MSDLFRLDGAVALVTGASGGLGLHFAQVAHAAGARVALAARRVERIEDAAAALGPGALADPLDVTDPAAIAAAFDATEAAFGASVTLLVNNAGVSRPRSLTETTPEDWDAVLDVNLRAVFLMCREAAARMGPGGGAIVNVASIYAERVARNSAAYAASKAAVAHLTRALAVELADSGVRVNALAPGYVETDLNRAFLRSPAGLAMVERIPQRRLATPGDLTGPFLLLASDAGRHMTGAALVVDGGHSVGAL